MSSDTAPGEPLAVGIDLGTTHSVVAFLDASGRPRILPDVLGRTLTPSVVAVDGTGAVVVGHPARERSARGVGEVAARFKSEMGGPTTTRLAGRDLRPEALSALVLREVHAVAEEQLQRAVERVVISVPAWFREPQRRATIEAAHIAGLEVLRLVNEPTAAALHYGLGLDPEPRTVAVLDLGGGTFDITILELFDGVADVLGSVGDVHLGGEDVTDLIIAWAARGAQLSPGRAGQLRVEAERAKRRLSVHQVANLDVGSCTRTLSRAELEHIAAPFSDRLTRTMQAALVQTGVHPDSLDAVLLVGGATRMPLVHAVAARVLGQEPQPLDDVDHAVACGAALQAGLVLEHRALDERLVSDVLTHSLGIAVVQYFEGEAFSDRFSPILHRGTTLPASRQEIYSTLTADQRRVCLDVCEGDRREASRNHQLGRVVVDGLPVQPHPDGRHPIAVRFTHDASGLLEVEARVVTTGEQVRAVLQRSGVRLDPAEQEARLQALAGLKVHPRELLPNRWLIERATRLVELQTGTGREALDALLTAFEAALEVGDEALVDLRRARLRAAVDAVAAASGLEFDL